VRPPVALVVAKAPVPGEAKTRLGRVVGPDLAADLAAAAWLDTLEACVTAFGTDRCHLALTGDLSLAARSQELTEAIRGWTVHEQRGDGFAERLRHAHEDVAAAAGAPVVQIGMDTPQVQARHLREVEVVLTDEEVAVLGPADDGGWWLLGVGSPDLLEHLVDVPMSTAGTGRLTRTALEKAGARVIETGALRDVDEPDDAEAVALLAPESRFARAWRDR
jgi:glycosyltransferase A (GT-A) superfamily protein (DUF2064 family)